MMIIFLSDNKQAVIAVLESNSELIKDALSELDEVSNAFSFSSGNGCFSLLTVPCPHFHDKRKYWEGGSGEELFLFDLILPAFLDTGLPRGNGHKWDSGPMRGAIPIQSHNP